MKPQALVSQVYAFNIALETGYLQEKLVLPISNRFSRLK
ncbi:hypothetical protein CpecG_0824 [Chlamydia pecorum MC/MarsBar]|uniref:Uncharacterized protein n=1 Tax=Chlamydia pecorum (strain ATCC VR-628 / DSM 29919 / E58) TaxID=331635 RepID=A0AA34RDW6_CHLPE|nr:hypothetical protein G5S_0955 [Chlamydia pecorum E58]ETF37065.1 hypothetical protein CpecG_0824 [Chlamydia pecorum MC/MarsBar]ETF37215.1 hypothetical protein CpecF_0823 [Chlamydia pecorum DBDeUG]ETF39435.1 hypothetical protein CpecA_0824 [Chlamydia pecorum IPTaLE]